MWKIGEYMDQSFYGLFNDEIFNDEYFVAQRHTPPALPVPPKNPPPVEAEPDPEPRKPRRWHWLILLFAICIIASYSAGYSVGASTQSATIVINSTNDNPPPVAANRATKWITTHTFNGNGPQQTELFTVAKEWKLSWTCTPTKAAAQYNIITMIYNVDGTIRDQGLNAICNKNTTSGNTYKHEGGQVYLDIEITGEYMLTVQELK
jgi:hypothetical protein